MSALNLSEYDAALLDKLDREADAIETHLHGKGAVLLTADERRNLKDALSALYARMAGLLNRYSNGRTG